MPWWQETSTPSLALIGHFLNFLRFFQEKTAVACGRRDVIVGDVTSRLPAERFLGGEEPPRQAKAASNPTAVTSSMRSSNQVYFQINSKVARNLHAKFGMNGTVPEFFTIFSGSKQHPKRPP
jgi:hypothetical protein